MSWDWYGVKTLYRLEAKGTPKNPDQDYNDKTTMIEERVVLVKARNFDEANEKGEKEASNYARSLRCINSYGQKVNARYLDTCDCFRFYDMPNVDVEVFSMMGMVNRKIPDDTLLDWRFGFRSDLEKDNERARKKFFDGNSEREIMNIAVKVYFRKIPEGRRTRIKKIHALILKLYPKAFVSMGYKIPTYHLGGRWIALANQKRYVSLYTCDERHIKEFKKKHPTIKTGKGCINFQDKDTLPLADLRQVIVNAMKTPKPVAKKK